MQLNNLTILLKTKGGHKEGMGDVTSSLALAEEFRRNNYKVLFVVNNNESVINLVSQNNFEYYIAEDLAEMASCIEDKRLDIAILNQLKTPEKEALLFKKCSKMLVTIEDTGSSARLADLRFNVLYPIDEAITDFKFMPLARIYQEKHKSYKEILEKVGNILVIQGGSDTYGFTPKIVRALYLISRDININVVLGPNFSHNDELNDAMCKIQRGYNLIRGKNDLSNLMMEADLAISAGGNTLFELACLGVPAIVVCGELFEVETADRLQKENFGINLGFGKQVDDKDICNAVNHLIYDTQLRIEMRNRGKELINGRGAQKMIQKISDFF